MPESAYLAARLSKRMGEPDVGEEARLRASRSDDVRWRGHVSDKALSGHERLGEAYVAPRRYRRNAYVGLAALTSPAFVLGAREIPGGSGAGRALGALSMAPAALSSVAAYGYHRGMRRAQGRQAAIRARGHQRSIDG